MGTTGFFVASMAATENGWSGIPALATGGIVAMIASFFALVVHRGSSGDGEQVSYALLG